MSPRASLIFPLMITALLFSPISWGQAKSNTAEKTYTVIFNVQNDRVSVKVLKEGKTIHDRQLRGNVREIEQQVSRFMSAFETRDWPTPRFWKRFDPDLAKALYIELLSQALEKLPLGSNLRIIPDYPLALIPFEALVVDGTPQWKDENNRVQVSGLTYLGDRYSVSYGRSSASKAKPVPQKRQSAEERILVVADPVFDQEDTRIKAESHDKRRQILKTMPDHVMGLNAETALIFPRLPLTGIFAEYIKKLYPATTDVLTGAGASKLTLMGLDLSRYSTLVFATHSYFGRNLPGIEEPVLVLSLLNQPKEYDGFLRASEANKLKLNADLVVLLASQSGLGKYVPGEGIESMGNAFLDAGARSVLVSLWTCSESASMRLGEGFFRNLKVGKSKLEALKLARYEIRKAGYDHPFYWAPFILVGEVQ